MHRAHILIDLGDLNSAKAFMTLCEQSTFSEIQGCLTILNAIINKSPPSSLTFSKYSRLLPGWLDRLKLSLKRKKMGIKSAYLEEKIIFLLSIRNRTKQELIKRLYGDVLDSEYTQNRFFVLLNRIEKKFPGLINKFENQTFGIE